MRKKLLATLLTIAMLASMAATTVSAEQAKLDNDTSVSDGATETKPVITMAKTKTNASTGLLQGTCTDSDTAKLANVGVTYTPGTTTEENKVTYKFTITAKDDQGQDVEVQAWAKDTMSNWFDLAKVGVWGGDGFNLPNQSITTQVYLTAAKNCTVTVKGSLQTLEGGTVIADFEDSVAITVPAADASISIANPEKVEVLDLVEKNEQEIEKLPKFDATFIPGMGTEAYVNGKNVTYLFDITAVDDTGKAVPVQAWAKDSHNNWFDLEQEKRWGPEEGFDYQLIKNGVTTPVYLAANRSCTVTVTGTMKTVDTEGAKTVAEFTNTVDVTCTASVQVTIPQTKSRSAAQVGTKNYATLEEAITAVNSADTAATITLLQDCELKAPVTITAPISIVGDGKEIKPASDYSAGASSAMITVSSSNVSLSNVNLTGSETGTQSTLEIKADTDPLTDITLENVKAKTVSTETGANPVVINGAAVIVSGDKGLVVEPGAGSDAGIVMKGEAGKEASLKAPDSKVESSGSNSTNKPVVEAKPDDNNGKVPEVEVPNLKPSDDGSFVPKPPVTPPATGGGYFAPSASWKSNANGWWYEYADGTYAASTWKEINGAWYYFGSNGYMATGWQKLGGVWYYLGSSGAMQTGWVKTGDHWYYMSSTGAMQTGWVNEGDSWYYTHADGSMATGWNFVNGTWYYLAGNGSMKTGWVELNGKWYYLNKNGAMAANTTTPDGYQVNANGEWVR